jgi:hypothetical protein
MENQDSIKVQKSADVEKVQPFRFKYWSTSVYLPQPFL